MGYTVLVIINYSWWWLIIEVLRNEILVACQSASPAKRPKCRNDFYFWIHAFRNKDHIKQFFVELILISEVTNSEIKTTSTFRSFPQSGKLTRCQDFISKNVCYTSLKSMTYFKTKALHFLRGSSFSKWHLKLSFRKLGFPFQLKISQIENIVLCFCTI